MYTIGAGSEDFLATTFFNSTVGGKVVCFLQAYPQSNQIYIAEMQRGKKSKTFESNIRAERV